MDPSSSRLPTAFIPHGGGPWPVMDLPMMPSAETAPLADYMRSIARAPLAPVKAVLMVSAHWERPVPTVNSGARPPMLYDYGGFPEAAYRLQWPAPGEPALAARVSELLGASGFETAEDDERGFDHGTFIPMMLAYPEAKIPTVQLSLQRGLDPGTHLAMGRALAPLRDEGVYILGSGNSFHNLRALFSGSSRMMDAARAFDAWLAETVQLEPVMRSRRLEAWDEAPGAREAHPREEHLIPLMVAVGAAENEPGLVSWTGTMSGYPISAHQFG